VNLNVLKIEAMLDVADDESLSEEDRQRAIKNIAAMGEDEIRAMAREVYGEIEYEKTFGSGSSPEPLLHGRSLLDVLRGEQSASEPNPASPSPDDAPDRDPLRYAHAADFSDWHEVRSGVWYSPTAQETRQQQSRPGSRAHAPSSQQASGHAPVGAHGHAAMPTPPAPAGPHFRRTEEGFARALGGVWNGAADKRHPADITVFQAGGLPAYHVELKDRLESDRDTANIDPNAALRKLEMIRAARDRGGRLVPFVTVLPMWRSNQGGTLAGIVVRFKLTFSPGEYEEAMIPGLNDVNDLNKPTIQQRLRRLIEAEVQQVDRTAYEQALREESKAAARYFQERLERSQRLVEAFENPPPKKRGQT
jgi:hypothetical protein